MAARIAVPVPIATASTIPPAVTSTIPSAIAIPTARTAGLVTSIALRRGRAARRSRRGGHIGLRLCRLLARRIAWPIPVMGPIAVARPVAAIAASRLAPRPVAVATAATTPIAPSAITVVPIARAGTLAGCGTRLTARAAVGGQCNGGSARRCSRHGVAQQPALESSQRADPRRRGC